MQKVQNVENVNILSDCETTCKKRKDSFIVVTRNGKLQEGREHYYAECSRNND